MIKDFDTNLEGLISQLHTLEPRINSKGRELSPREVRSRARDGLRRIVAYGDGLWIDKEEMTRAAKALGYYNENWFEDARQSCRNHLKLNRYFSSKTITEAIAKTLEITALVLIGTPYITYHYLKGKARRII
jgi:hypothetical protein